MDAVADNLSTDRALINQLTEQFFSVFDNREGRQPEWTILDKLCIPEILIIKKTALTQTVYNLTGFVEPRKSLLTNGTLSSFSEHELEHETTIIGNIAQRRCRYQKTGYIKATKFIEHGTKLFQFIKTAGGWKISSLVWEDEQE